MISQSAEDEAIADMRLILKIVSVHNNSLALIRYSTLPY